MNRVLGISAAVCVIAAAIIDLRTRRIPNWLTGPSVLLAFLLNLYLDGIHGLTSSLLGLLAGFSLLIFVYLLGGMGAGDVKLLSAVGAFVGPLLVFYTFIWMALVGGVLAMMLIIQKKAIPQTFRNLKLLFLGWFLGSSGSEANITIKNQSLHKLSYGVAIAAGTILAVCFQQIPGIVIQNGSIHVVWWGV